MNVYPITIGSDTGSVGESLTRFANQPPAVRLGTGAAVGAIIGQVIGKKPVLGAILGAIGGYIAADWNPR